jgi:hypothetical protein
MTIATDTGGEFFRSANSQDLVERYENLGNEIDIDTTDNDNDGLYDILEISGIRLENGEIIYTDPLDPDTGGDGLLDGEEVDTHIQYDEFTEVEFRYSSSSTSSVLADNRAFPPVPQKIKNSMKSSPFDADCDNDGIIDAYDLNPRFEGDNSDIDINSDKKPTQILQQWIMPKLL